MISLKKGMIIVLCLLLLSLMASGAVAPGEKVGQVCLKDSWLNVRDGAGTEYRVIDALYDDELVKILDVCKSGKGELWYKVFFARDGYERIGYVHSDYVEIKSDEVFSYDADFESELSAEGFPESYKESLRKLHTLYPQWKFEAYHTGLDWQSVIEAESENGRNLVPDYSTVPSSWKSTQKGAFDWKANRWIVFSGNHSVQASEKVIGYYMDPRNFLTEEGIFQFEKLTYDESQTVKGVEGVLSGTFMSNKKLPGSSIKYSEACVSVGKKLGISPYFLASRLRQEQGVKGDSALISGSRKGYESYYNYFNVGASGTGDSVITNGLSRAVSEGWNTPYKSIEGGADIISKNYILSGQDTLYLQKFDVESTYWDLYWHQYMQTISAPSSEALSVYKAYKSKNLLDSSLIFKIPVYENMPDEKVTAPTGDGNPNCRLAGLKVKGYEDAFTFDMHNHSYKMEVSKGVSKIEVVAEAVDRGATIDGTGLVELYHGMNVIEVKCTAESGANWVYRIYVTRAY
ncbi:MAG: hypothetical protein E7388_00210 [Ruminococcaceae bacterium]|nr:hypothetical protein [Oscillospiraceae bacterium]